MKKSLKFFSLRNVSILEQLLFEETVLRKTAENYFMFNQGSVGTKIVLGYSGKPNELINIDLAKRYVTVFAALAIIGYSTIGAYSYAPTSIFSFPGTTCAPDQAYII